MPNPSIDPSLQSSLLSQWKAARSKPQGGPYGEKHRREAAAADEAHHALIEAAASAGIEVLFENEVEGTDRHRIVVAGVSREHGEVVLKAAGRSAGGLKGEEAVYRRWASVDEPPSTAECVGSGTAGNADWLVTKRIDGELLSLASRATTTDIGQTATLLDALAILDETVPLVGHGDYKAPNAILDHADSRVKVFDPSGALIFPGFDAGQAIAESGIDNQAQLRALVRRASKVPTAGTEEQIWRCYGVLTYVFAGYRIGNEIMATEKGEDAHALTGLGSTALLNLSSLGLKMARTLGLGHSHS